MKDSIIYYQKKLNETDEQTISYIDNVIVKLDEKLIIKSVYIDLFNDRSELYSFANFSPKDLKVIFIDSNFDDFDSQLLDELARVNNLKYLFY